ncbi:Efflux pump FUS6 [Metarhizium brunneum]|uniref:Efflux pump FUS6 n=1 Tax=Metarhizium brunneum TaxID=500148 RepID=A0A7D5ZBD6_9HYPO|nr:Efflux pump FUS6 [Metarhizium brunneum]
MFLLIPGSAVVGIILPETGRYCPLHAVGFVLSTLGPRLNVLLDKDTHAGVWAMLQIADAVGGRFLLPTLLPAALASLPEKDVASTTGMYSFLRSFGYGWDITIPSVTFQNRASELSTGAFVQALPQPVKSQILDAYLETLKAVWHGAMAFGATALIAVAVEKHVPLRTVLGSKYEMEEKANKDRQDVVEAATGGGQDHCVESSIAFVYRASLGRSRIFIPFTEVDAVNCVHIRQPHHIGCLMRVRISSHNEFGQLCMQECIKYAQAPYN